MRELKFRGRDIETGKQVIYGTGYVDLNGKKYIFDAKFGMAYHVAPESVSQLVGRDRIGREVYEGDLLIDTDGKIFKAVSQPNFPHDATLQED